VGDEAHMARAIELAERGWGRVSPNPLVGAVVVSADGRRVGEGWHAGPGTPHAEVVAIREAGEAARGATLYTSLEPCDHVGRTPPCTHAILVSGIASVVSALADPNPIVDGRGYGRLREAGLDVRDGVLADVAAEQNRAYVTHVRTGRPYVVWKVGASLDGRVAARDGSSRWITGEAARTDAHRLRAWADAVAVGAGTALADDPSLTVRGVAAEARPPLRVLVDARGRVRDGRILDASAPTLVATTPAADGCRASWEAAGADVETFDPTSVGDVPLDALVERLGKRDVQAVVLEGGPTLSWSAIEAGVVDELVLYLAPKLVGGSDAPAILGGTGFAPITDALDVRIRSIERIGDDVKVVADVHRDR
jgi:diaminohydroxyphosphoribosylaminopyrimidine deaminase/5-amino-6-(5-phosphoribosylamino)uracil reductase